MTALAYEIIWTRMLTLVFGHTVFSVSVVLAAFMAGLGFGSYLWGHVIDRISGGQAGDAPGKSSPIMIYAVIEILIFATGALLSLVFSEFDVFYAWFHQWLPESPGLFNLIKAMLAFLLMFIPTTLMGATLPIISKYYVTDNSRLGSQVGILYGLNTFGAVVGCLLTGFVFISLFGVLQTALLTSLVNLVIGIGCIRIYQEDEQGKIRTFRFPKLSLPPRRWNREQKLWMSVSFICGFTALAYEVLWTRLLVFSISSTVYSFSMMLAVFLFGIALGSFGVIPLIRKYQNLRTVLICLQAGAGIYVLFSLFAMEYILSPPWNSYNLQNPMAVFLRYARDASALMLVPSILLGMNFPILIRIVSGGYEHVGRGTGQIYASNTLGAILGSLLAGFVFLPLLKSESSLISIASLNLLAALFLFLTGDYSTPVLRKGVAAAFAGALVLVNVTLPRDLLQPFFMRDSVGQRDIKKLLFFEEGLTATVAVFKDNYGILDPEAKRLVTNGISMSASNYIATRYMKLFAHVPILLSDNPENVLVICYGTGQTTGAAGIHPRVKSVESMELSSIVVRSSKIFSKENHDALNNPKVNIILQDGRNHLLTTRKLYDVVTGEPPPPRTAFTVNLYTRDYYELINQRLKPGGIVAQWVPLHSQSAKEIDMHFRTFLSVYPHAMAWLSVANEILLIGSNQPINIDFQKLKTRMENPVVKQALDDIDIESPYSLLSAIWFLEEQMEKLSIGQPLITDNRPRIEFYLDFADVIKISGLERLVFNRAPVEEIEGRIINWTDADRKTFRRHYKLMDLYQRGVMYGSRPQLLEAMNLADNEGLYRYHLQAGKDQIRRLMELVEKDPGDMESLLNLGHAHFQSGDYNRSIEFLQKALEKDSGQSFANLYMGYNLMELERFEEAKTYFKAAVKKDPGQLRAVMQEIALIELLQKMETERESPALMLAAAQFYNVKNEFRKSLSYSLKALDKNPENAKALQSALFSYRGLGEPEETLALGARYQRVNPDDIHFQYIMGELYVKTLRYEEAVPYLENVLKQDDTYRNAQNLLDNCLKILGREKKAA